MTRRLLLSYVSIAVIVLAVLEIPLGLVFARSERRNLIAELKHDALSLALLAEETLEGNARADLQSLARDYERRTSGRVVIVDTKSTLVADSSVERLERRPFRGRPEIDAALSGRESTGTRHSDTLSSDLLFVAVPVTSGGRVYGAARITFTPTELDARVRAGWLVLGAIGLVVLVMTTVVSVVLARSVSRPLLRLREAAARLGGGDLSSRVELPDGPPEVRELATVFNAVTAQLEQLVHAQDEFVADASHQLRSPLQALRLRLENAEAELGAGEARDQVAAASTEAARLGRIVEGLLALARTDREGPPRQRIDVGQVVGERAATWTIIAQDRGLSIVYAPPRRRITALATPGHLEQVIDNLIANAIDASPTGGRVLLRVEGGDTAVDIHVTDDGPGMSAEERVQALDRFWRAPGAKRGGSGLGLTIAKRLVAVDGGTLRLGAANGHGLDAVVRIPLPA